MSILTAFTWGCVLLTVLLDWGGSHEHLGD